MREPDGSDTDAGTPRPGNHRGSRHSTREATPEQELRAVHAEVALLAGKLSHELRTPLTAILANAEMLAAEPAVVGDEDLAWMVDGIARGATRLNEMIEGMLDHEGVVGPDARTDSEER